MVTHVVKNSRSFNNGKPLPKVVLTMNYLKFGMHLFGVIFSNLGSLGRNGIIKRGVVHSILFLPKYEEY